MRQSWWKKWISYFFEIPVEKSASDKNPLLLVTLKKGKYQLSTEEAIYSFDVYYDNFGQAFRQMNLSELPVQNALLLGLGLGSIPVIIEQENQKILNYTAVEYDEEVIRLAQKYSLNRLNSPITIYHTDAMLFVSQCDTKFDLICMDVFNGDKIPEELVTTEFLSHLNRLLSKEGILLFNCLAYSEKDYEEAKNFYDNVFLPLFPDASHISVQGNWILINRGSLFIKEDERH